jgi:RNA polymerase sigma factor (sigma-70 family)
MHTSVPTSVISSESVVACAAASLQPLDINQLFREHHQHLIRFVQRYVRNAEDAEDVVQNTFIEAVRCADRFSGLSKPSTWLFGIALNLARNQIRRNCANLSDTVDEGVIEAIADMDGDPVNLIERREMAGKVQAMLNDLPVRIRDTFEAVLEGACTYEEAAAQLRIPIGTVRSRVSRVRMNLRSQFGPQ